MIKAMFVLAAALVAAPVVAQTEAPSRPYCSAKITDGCQQTAAQQARAMSAAQAEARDARYGGWAPDKRAKAAGATNATPTPVKKAKPKHRTVRVTKVQVAPAAPQ